MYAQKLIYDLLEFDQASSVIMQQCQTPMDQAKKWIETHIYDTIAVKDVASALHMSESNFSHAFKNTPTCRRKNIFICESSKNPLNY